MRTEVTRRIKGLFAGLFIVAAVANCPTVTPTPLAVLSLDINDGAATTDTRTVTLNNTCQGNPTEYIASESVDFSGAVWRPYSTHPTFELSAGHGLKQVYFKVRTAKQVSPLATESVTLTLIIVPSVTSVSINRGAASTTWRTVTVYNTCTGDPTDFMASESETFEGAFWQPYGEIPAFLLSEGNGAKTVHFRVKNIEAESPVVTASISLAETALPAPRAFGGENTSAYSVDSTADGGNVFAGEVQGAAGGAEIYLGKSDASGLLEWQVTFDNPRFSDWTEGVAQASDGGYVVSGVLLSATASFPIARMTLIKTDSVGNLKWQASFDGLGYYSLCNVVRRTADGGYALAGDTGSVGVRFSPVYLVKTDASGRLEWEMLHEAGIAGTTTDLRQTPDGGYILAGYSESTDYELFYFLLKADSSGRRIWEKEYPTDAETISSSRVRQTNDGGYVFVATHGPDPAHETVGVTKTDSSGKQLWQREFQGLGRVWGLSGIVQTEDGGYIAVATTQPFFGSGVGAMYVVRMDSTGALVWQNTFSGQGGASGNDICSMDDGGYVVSGSTGPVNLQVSPGSGAYLVKIDETGNQVW